MIRVRVRVGNRVRVRIRVRVKIRVRIRVMVGVTFGFGRRDERGTHQGDIHKQEKNGPVKKVGKSCDLSN
jgi:hypothetical protein